MRHFIVTLILIPILFGLYAWDGGDGWWVLPSCAIALCLIGDVQELLRARETRRAMAELVLRRETDFLDRFGFDKCEIKRHAGEDNTAFRARIVMTIMGRSYTVTGYRDRPVKPWSSP